MGKADYLSDRRQDASNGKYRIQVITKLFDLLGAFTADEPELTLRDIVARTGQNESGAFRMVSNLVDLGVLERDPETRKYRIGTRLYELGALAAGDMRKVALPRMRSLRDQYGHTVGLSVHDAESIVRVEVVESDREFQMAVRIGSREPLHCTGAGKCILAFSEPEQQAALIRGVELEPFTPNTITEVEDLERELATIRSHVIAHDRAEYDPSTECVAAPIFDRGGRIRAALSVISPTGAVSFSTRRGIEKDLVVSGEAISRGLLWVGAYPPP